MGEPPVDIVDRGRTLVVEIEEVFCDACGTARVQPHLYAKLRSGGSLAFCGSHGTQHLAKLREDGARIVDLRDEIEP